MLNKENVDSKNLIEKVKFDTEEKFESIKCLNNEKCLKELKKLFKMKDAILQGKIKTLPEDDRNYMFIEDIISNESGSYIFNPFNNKRIDEIYCRVVKDKEKKRLCESLNIGDTVVISFRSKNRISIENLIEGEADSIGKIVSVDNIVNGLKEKESLFYKRIFSENIDFREGKLLVEEKFLDSINEVLKKGTEDYSNKKKEREYISSEIDELNKEYEKVLRRQKEYVSLGLSEKVINRNKSDELEEYISTEKMSITKAIQTFLANRDEKKLYYSMETIEQFYMALHTNQIIIISGKPGVGKTSLVEGMAAAIGATNKTISVRPNWTDTQDLLGYYNPIEKKYMGTIFLDTIIEANKNPKQLYFISLDEMNIACIEYYFSEVLSKLYSEDRILNLYSEEIARQIYSDIDTKLEFYLDGKSIDEEDINKRVELIKKINIEEYLKMRGSLKSIEEYPPVVNLPRNVKFIGTINKDESTKNISPKVIDRSFIMYLGLNEREKNEKYEKDNSIKISLLANRFLSKSRFENKNINEIETIIEKASKLDIQFNNRNIMHTIEMLEVEEVGKKNRIDYIIAGKILPKFNLNIEACEEGTIGEFEDAITSYPISKKIFADMKKYWEEYEVLTYWR